MGSEGLEPQCPKPLIKDPYSFEFLSLGADLLERDLHRSLLDHLRSLILELGKGFAFVGSQYPLEVGDQQYFIDLLFYHLRLRCFVVIELKVEGFKPEFALRDSSKPMGVAQYQLSTALPERLKRDLPTMEELERKFRSMTTAETCS